MRHFPYRVYLNSRKSLFYWVVISGVDFLEFSGIEGLGSKLKLMKGHNHLRSVLNLLFLNGRGVATKGNSILALWQRHAQTIYDSGLITMSHVRRDIAPNHAYSLC